MGPTQSVLAGILQVLGITLLMAVAIGLLSSGRITRVGTLLRRHWLARHSPGPPPPAAWPLERIAVDARRIRSDLRGLPPDAPAARRRGILRAYEDALLDACRALDVPDTLSALPPGPERDAERLRVEYLLERAGLVL